MTTGQTCVLMGISTVAKVTRDSCLSLWDELHEVVMPEQQEEMWKAIADEFCEKTQFLNCIRALHSKRIRMKKLSQSRSLYFNY